mgnify:CR=1 FL=1
MLSTKLIAIGNVIFNPAFVILATWAEDKSLIVTLADHCEQVFYGQDAVLAWNCIMENCALTKAMPTVSVR